MVSQFEESSAGTITLDSIPCNGNLTTGVTYTPTPGGLVAATRYLIDISNDAGDPFPGANFTQGFHVYGGKTIKAPGIAGNLTAWVAFGSSTRLNPGTPQNCPTRSSDYMNSRLVFSSAGQVIVRIAWSNNPSNGTMVSPPCRYNVQTDSVTNTAAPASSHTAAPASDHTATPASSHTAALASSNTTAPASNNTAAPASNNAVADIPALSFNLFVLVLPVFQCMSLAMT